MEAFPENRTGVVFRIKTKEKTTQARIPVLRFETLPAIDRILGSNTEIDDESWPGFFHRGAPGGEERLF